MDYRETIMMGAILALLFGPPLFYVRKIKHPSRSLLKEYACFLAVLYGMPFVTAFFLGSMLDFSASVLSQLFRLDLQTSAELAKTSVSSVAVLVSLPIVYIAWKTMRKPVAGLPELSKREQVKQVELSYRRSA